MALELIYNKSVLLLNYRTGTKISFEGRPSSNLFLYLSTRIPHISSRLQLYYLKENLINIVQEDRPLTLEEKVTLLNKFGSYAQSPNMRFFNLIEIYKNTL